MSGTATLPGWDVLPELAPASEGGPPPPQQQQARVPWVPTSLAGEPGGCGRACRLPLAAMLSRMTCTVHAGETLYLPALWYHEVGHVGANGGAGECCEVAGDVTLAVNWWLAMDFEAPVYAAHRLARALAPLLSAEAEAEAVRSREGGTSGAAEAVHGRGGGEVRALG